MRILTASSQVRTFAPRPRQASRLALALIGFSLGLPVVFGSAASAQTPEKTEEEEKIPPPVEYDGRGGNEPKLVTRDGVQLAATYFPGTEGKETVPVILLHMHKGDRTDYGQLAAFLQSQGHAVLVPDLRGHGESTTGNNLRVPLIASNLTREDFVDMVRYDMETLKEFLREKNNEGLLNIQKLCVVGAEMGASVALYWTRFDWERPPVGSYKIGQDVAAMVLISPEWSTPGLPLQAAFRQGGRPIALADPELAQVYQEPFRMDMRREVSALLVAGKDDSKAVRDTRRVFTLLKRYHPDPPENERKEKQDLFFATLDTSLQGTKMLGVRSLNLERMIGQFIQLRLVNRAFPWRVRKSDPHAG